MPSGCCSLGGEQGLRSSAIHITNPPGERISPQGRSAAGGAECVVRAVSPHRGRKPPYRMMHSLEPLPTALLQNQKHGTPSRLKVLDEATPVRRPSASAKLAPMPFLPVAASGPVADLDWDGDYSSEEIGELDDNTGFPARRRLPRFVPLQPELYATHRDPWSVYSMADMVRIYLPEVSISTGLVAIAGVLGGRLFSRFAGGSEVSMVLAGYLVLHVLILVSIYGSAKAAPSTRTRSRMRHLLLGCFLLLTSHLLANGLLMAGV